MWQTISRTFKEIDDRHTMICIEEVEATRLCGFSNSHRVEFCIKNTSYPSKEFATEEEAIKFRDEIMGGIVTNREKYVERQLKNRDLAMLIAYKFDRCSFCNKKDCKFVCQPLEYRFYEFCITHIEKWLASEVYYGK